jgi:hypothetical protein
VIGRAGGYLRVGNHILFVHSRALRRPVRITAVAPADTVRWVRFQPDGLVFQTSPGRRHGRPDQSRQRFGDVDGWGAILYTSYKDCGVPLSDTLRVAQVTDSRTILGYLTTLAFSSAAARANIESCRGWWPEAVVGAFFASLAADVNGHLGLTPAPNS